MKLHLISILFRSVRYSGFFLFPAGAQPQITPEIQKKLIGELPRGTTVSIG